MMDGYSFRSQFCQPYWAVERHAMYKRGSQVAEALSDQPQLRSSPCSPFCFARVLTPNKFSAQHAPCTRSPRSRCVSSVCWVAEATTRFTVRRATRSQCSSVPWRQLFFRRHMFGVLRTWERNLQLHRLLRSVRPRAVLRRCE